MRDKTPSLSTIKTLPKISPLELISPEAVMWPACPSTDKVPDIAAEPVNGNPALTPDSPEPSPVSTC